jgi:saccharopine dehydrogenase (NAD+, L-lysine-forming)
MLKKIFIRNETYCNELRTPIVPCHINKLINYGFTVYIQTSKNRCYNDNEYIINGAIIVYDEWYNYNDCLIIGIKELDNIDKLNCHTHIYFSHSFKNQIGSNIILKSFYTSSSTLHDLEYFKKGGNRLIAFGYYAGIVGCALGLINYNKRLSSLTCWNSLVELVDSIPNINCKIAIIGSKGRCGSGVKYILDLLNIQYDEFNRDSNKNDLVHYNIIYNCIHLTNNIGIWFDSNTNFYNKMTFGKKYTVLL